MKLFPLSVLVIAMFVDLPPTVRAACENMPSGFLPHGPAAGDTEFVLSTDTFPHQVTYTDWPYLGFGVTAAATSVTIIKSHISIRFAPSTAPDIGIEVHARKEQFYTQSDFQGSIFMRHSTSCDDLIPTDAILCGPFDGVLVVTYVCTAEHPLSDKFSFQILVAHSPSKTIVIIQYGTPMDPAGRFIWDSVHSSVYPLNVADHLVIIDVLAPVDGALLPLESMPCVVPVCSEEIAIMDSCDEPPTKVTICSKSQGVGHVVLEYTCRTGGNDDVQIRCKALCCCEPFSSGPSEIQHTGPFCTRNDVMNWGFGADSLTAKDDFCTGHDLPDTPEPVPSCPEP